MNEKIARRWYCDNCQKELHRRSWPASCSQHSVRRICGYSQCSKAVGSQTACCEEHIILGYREALRISAPPITTTSGEWLFRERLRLGLKRSQVLSQLKEWGIKVSSATLATTEVKDLPLPAEWLMPLTALNLQAPGTECAPEPGTTESELGWAESTGEDLKRGMAEVQNTLRPPNQPEPPQTQASASTRLLEVSKEEAKGDEPPWLREATKHAQVAAVRAAMKAAAPNSDVSVGQFLLAWIDCEAAWTLIKALPLCRFWSSFHPYPDLLVPEEPKEEPTATFLPKLLAFHLERETVLALARPDLTEMTLTGDLFTGLAKVGALDVIDSFPFLTFCYAMEYGAFPLPPITSTDGVDSDLKADFSTGRPEADG